MQRISYWLRALVVLALAWWMGAAAAATILVFGDSLSAAYGMETRDSWPALLEDRLRQTGLGLQVVNASRRGETSDGGRRRLPDLLSQTRPAWVILQLGANDGLRRQSLDNLNRNLNDMLGMIKASGARPVLVGMELPPNYGRPYAASFHAVFADTARRSDSLFVPFLLQNVVGDPNLFQSDHLHPTAAAQPRLLDVVWRVLAPALQTTP